MDEAANGLGKDSRGDDWEISAAGARVRTFVIAAREDRLVTTSAPFWTAKP